MATVELADSYVDRVLSPQGIAFLTDAIIIQRYRGIDGEPKCAMAVVKLRARQHGNDPRERHHCRWWDRGGQNAERVPGPPHRDSVAGRETATKVAP